MGSISGGELIAILLVVPIALAVWVYRDGKRRANPHAAMHAAVWAVGLAICWPVVIVVYLIVRPDFRTSGENPGQE